jgi:hypothetical protein
VGELRSFHRIVSAAVVALCLASPAYADATLLLGEPYGKFGSLTPTGHAAVYLTRVCASSPTVLRRCQPGETGVVISRYHHVGGFDWLAVPLIPYLYAVERASDVPESATKLAVANLRDQYRQLRLRDVVPNTESGEPPPGNWFQLAGAAYDRKLFAFTVTTSAAQDDELIRSLNARDNVDRFNFFFRNCADFARDIIHTYYPKAIRGSLLADLGLTTPKHIAKSFVSFATRRPELGLTSFVIPQVPGSRPASADNRGVAEGLIKTKKWSIPLLVTQPWLTAGFAAGYLVKGRFNPDRYAVVSYEPEDLERRAILIANVE